MTFDEAFQKIPANGWLTEAEARGLWHHAHGTVLEVGCYYGRSTCLMLYKGCAVDSVDPIRGFDSDDKNGMKTAKALIANVRATGLYDMWKMHQMRIEEWTPKPMDVAYLDGDHTYEGTIGQIKVALACHVKTILVHDVNDSGEGTEVKRACLELLGPWKGRVERLAVWELT